MTIIDRIKYEADSDDIFIWKFPSDQLRLGAQLLVNQSQEAIFFKNGIALDIFGPGRHTLSTNNIPLLDKLINLPFGGQTPFIAEVWYINKAEKRDLKWGTNKPIQVIDPIYHYPINVRAFGSWGIQVLDGASFLNKIVGTQKIGDSKKIEAYFEGAIIQNLSEIISKFFTEQKKSIFEANSQLSEISLFASTLLNTTLNQYGIGITNFNVERISMPDEDMLKFQNVLGKKMEVEQLSQTQISPSYNTIKSFDVLEKAAENESGTAGGMMAGGLGLGMGMGVGVPLGQQVGQAALPSQVDNQSGNNDDPIEKLSKIKKMLEMELISEAEYEAKKKEILAKI